MSIPIIDFERLAQNDPQTSKNLVKGVTETGFLIIENTSIDTEEIKKLFEMYRAFFALPESEKDALDMANTGSNRGWGRSQSEQVNPDANPDYKQVFDVGAEIPRDHPILQIPSQSTYYAPNIWPNHPEFKHTVQTYYQRALNLSLKLLDQIADAADLPRYFFADKFDPPMALLRANYYPSRPNEARANDFGIAEHTDYGCLTLLACDGVPGLEVKLGDGQWVSVDAQIGQFVINFGEMIERWSNQKIRATPHRVVGTKDERYSIPFFCNPAYETNVASIGSEETVFAGDWLTKRYNETYVHKQKDAS